jgi:acetyl/propionyl-CoA carboxylase alpha subunit
MEYKLKVRERTFRIETPALDKSGRATVLVEDEEKMVSFLPVSSNELHMTVDGQSIQVCVARTLQGTWVWIEGRPRLVEDARISEKRRSRGAGSLPSEVTPPTPAVVIRVLVEPGQGVKRGEGVVVVSAMKMEITLAAPYTGMVTAVNTSAGSQVKPGDILVEIEKSPEEEHDE